MKRKGALRARRAPEPLSQFTLKLSAAQHKQLQVLAFEADMTMRGFVMDALKDKGLSVAAEDLLDRRKR